MMPHSDRDNLTMIYARPSVSSGLFLSPGGYFDLGANDWQDHANRPDDEGVERLRALTGTSQIVTAVGKASNTKFALDPEQPFRPVQYKGLLLGVQLPAASSQIMVLMISLVGDVAIYSARFPPRLLDVI